MIPSTHGIVATVHPLASQAGVNAMRSGGNAIDAAVAAALTLGVVDGHNSGIGGGCFMLIHPDRATPVPAHGLPPDAETRLFEKHTTHFSTADAEGNWVACTATVNTMFGSKVIVPGTGIFLNNEMDDFAIDAGVPNAFKLVGAEANAVAPGKRPLSSMSPTLVLKDGQPILTLGAAGGPTIISQTVLNLIAMLDLGMTPGEALAQPRIHQQWQPDQLRIEEALPADIRAALQKRGHQFFIEPSYGASQIVARSADGRGFVGASDPRTGGRAAGF